MASTLLQAETYKREPKCEKYGKNHEYLGVVEDKYCDQKFHIRRGWDGEAQTSKCEKFDSTEAYLGFVEDKFCDQYFHYRRGWDDKSQISKCEKFDSSEVYLGFADDKLCSQKFHYRIGWNDKTQTSKCEKFDSTEAYLGFVDDSFCLKNVINHMNKKSDKAATENTSGINDSNLQVNKIENDKDRSEGSSSFGVSK